MVIVANNKRDNPAYAAPNKAGGYELSVTESAEPWAVIHSA
jgi:hypothetical protein